jgi:hypothetical protein
VVPPSDPREGGYRPYIQLTRLELRSVPLALTSGVSSRGAAARSVTMWPPQLRTTEVAPTTKNHGGPLLGPSADPYCHPHQDMTRGAPAPPLKPFSRRSCLLRRHLPARATTMFDQRLCAICSPSVQPAAPRHASRGRSGVLEPVASGAGAQLPARPSGAHTSIAIYRCEVADCGTRPTDSDQKKAQE